MDAALAELDRSRFASRLRREDPTLWKRGARHQALIRNSLGWLRAPELMASKIPELGTFAEEVRAAGFNDVVLLGMGGASVGAEVFARTFQDFRSPGAAAASRRTLRLHVLDSTVPEAIAAATAEIDADRTLFIVATKSGTTVETLSLYRTFYRKLRARHGDRAGANFVAITDPGTNMEQLGHARRFRRVFLNPANIGGRHSVLSYFGLVPAALLGIDLAALLERAARLTRDCAESVPAARNPGVSLGAFFGALHAAGRDKLTIVASPAIAGFTLWAEQMIAESTGKEGIGLLPVCGEPLGGPRDYGSDRVFVYLRLLGQADAAQERCVRALARSGAPIATISMTDKLDLGREFMRWEIAAAAAAHLMRIDPFDEPNVQESKDAARRLLRELEQRGRLPDEAALAEREGVRLYADGLTGKRLAGCADLIGALRKFFKMGRRGGYCALMGYVEPSPRLENETAAIRALVRRRTGLATTFGYGPRLLHSTGQFHKGGPATGLYFQFTREQGLKIPIPGVGYDFGGLTQAQCLGDFQALSRRRRPVIRAQLEGDPGVALGRLRRALTEALR